MKVRIKKTGEIMNADPNATDHCPLCVVHSGRKGGIEFKRRQQELLTKRTI